MASKDVTNLFTTKEERERLKEILREVSARFPMLKITWPHKATSTDLKYQEYHEYQKKVILAGMNLAVDERGEIVQLESPIPGGLQEPATIPERFIGIDYGYGDHTVVQELVRLPRDKAKEFLYGLAYGAGPLHLHDAMEPNKNGDIFPPLPHIKPGDPIGVSKPFNDIIDRVNELSEQFMLGHTYCTKHRDISMGCSVKPTPCPACDQEEKERLKEREAEIPFISHDAIAEMYREGKISRQSFIREYMGQWPPEDEAPKPFPGETEGAFFRRMQDWRRDPRTRNNCYRTEPIPVRKEDDLPSAMGMKEMERYKKQQVEAQKDFGLPSQAPTQKALSSTQHLEKHSSGVEMFIEAQRKARPKQLVDKAIQQNEEALADKELKKVTEGVNWKPGHCRICGHANGCHHPRPQAPEGIEKPCEHLFLTRVKGAVATELGANMADGMTCAIYACRDCHKIVARIPMGALPK